MADENMFNQVTDPNPAPETPETLTFTVDASYKEYIDKYVGEGKKYPNVGELIKAYPNADSHISELTRDLGALKVERDSMKELLMTNLLNPSEPEVDPNIPDPSVKDDGGQPKPADASPPNPPANVEVDLKERIREALSEVSAEDRARANAQETERVMLERFESREAAIQAVRDKAAELGVAPEWIANMAFTSPKAYFVTMGIDPNNTPKSNNTPASRSDVDAQRLANANPGVKPGTYRWYQELRKSDPAKYRSPTIQNALMKDAQENPNFYKS